MTRVEEKATEIAKRVAHLYDVIGGPRDPVVETVLSVVLAEEVDRLERAVQEFCAELLRRLENRLENQL